MHMNMQILSEKVMERGRVSEYWVCGWGIEHGSEYFVGEWKYGHKLMHIFGKISILCTKMVHMYMYTNSKVQTY